MTGIRELRADLATHVRRAAAGQRVMVTLSGRPAAVLGPVHDAAAAADADSLVATLVASGALIPPRRADRRLATGRVQVWSNVRLDRLLREIRG